MTAAIDLGVFLMQENKRTNPYTTNRKTETKMSPVPMIDFYITTKVCFKTSATQTTKRHNPTHTQTEAQPQPPQKGPEKGKTNTNRSPYTFEISALPRETKKGSPQETQEAQDSYSVLQLVSIFIINQISLKYVHCNESNDRLKSSRKVNSQ